MKKIFKSKIFIAVIILLVLGGGVGAYFFVFKDKKTASTTVETKEMKVDSLLGYIGSEGSYSKFNTLLGMFDSAKYLTKNTDGLEPSLLIFAPNNDAFSKDDMKPYDALSSAAKEQIKLYHLAKIYPSSASSQANLELSDGKKVTTLAGKELTIKKSDSVFYVLDGKGRQANISVKYAVTSKGDRIYFVDSVLLFQ